MTELELQEPARKFTGQALQLWNSISSIANAPDAIEIGKHLPMFLTSRGLTPVEPSQKESFPNSAVVTIGLPWLSVACSDRWLGRRLVWWPQGIPGQSRISIVSSRLGRSLDKNPRWFDLLRTAVMRTDPVRECLCIVADTAPALAVQRAGILLRRNTLHFDTQSSCESVTVDELQQWIVQRFREEFSVQEAGGGLSISSGQAEASQEVADDRVSWKALLSPELAEGQLQLAQKSGQVDAAGFEALPVQDRLLFAAASRLCVLKWVSGGNVENLARQHLMDDDRKPVHIHFAADGAQRLVASALEQSADSSGNLIPWFVETRASFSSVEAAALPTTDELPEIGTDRKRASAESPVVSRPVTQCTPQSTPLSRPEDWLLHWTRERKGPWPGQTADDWMDELILGCDSADHSPVSALLRIAAEGRLRSSSEGIRGGHSVVAFTEVPLAEFRSRRVFRKHRLRFDFEPWGIGIRRATLLRLGVRPVIYGTDDDWDQLEACQQPWFQKDVPDDRATSNAEEREWRISGDCWLNVLPVEEVCCFVDNGKSAASLSAQVPWLVIVVPPGPGLAECC